MTNEQMKPNRYGKWHQAKQLVTRIQTTLNAGGYVVMATYTKATQYDRRHVNMFKATRTGAYVQSGQKWICIDGCSFRFATPR